MTVLASGQITHVDLKPHSALMGLHRCAGYPDVHLCPSAPSSSLHPYATEVCKQLPVMIQALSVSQLQGAVTADPITDRKS